MISWRQKGPVKPTGHKQEKELIPSTHVPPLKQELRSKREITSARSSAALTCYYKVWLLKSGVLWGKHL